MISNRKDYNFLSLFIIIVFLVSFFIKMNHENYSYTPLVMKRTILDCTPVKDIKKRLEIGVLGREVSCLDGKGELKLILIPIHFKSKRNNIDNLEIELYEKQTFTTFKIVENNGTVSYFLINKL